MDILCLLLSPSSVTSPWVIKEIDHALYEREERGLKILAIILRPCEIPDKLKVSLSCLSMRLMKDLRMYIHDYSQQLYVLVISCNWLNLNNRREPLVTTIKEVIDYQKVELEDSPTYTMSEEMSFAWGTDDTDAIQKTLYAAKETGLAVGTLGGNVSSNISLGTI